MTADDMREILKKKYGIRSDEEFWKKFKEQKDLDISIFVMPLRREEETA